MTETDTVGKCIDRDDILSGALEARVVASGGQMRIKPAEERLAVMRSMLEEVPSGADPWLFGYGSLIWNPAFDFAERRIGRVHGYHRYFSFWTTAGRGSPERPGLMLALERGGSCRGVVYRVERDRAAHEMRSVFLRELMGGAYHPRWVNVHCGDETVRAITFVSNHAYENFAGILPIETVADHIAHATGHLGRCSDYLVNTVRHLHALGIDDRRLSTLLALVDERSPTRE